MKVLIRNIVAIATLVTVVGCGSELPQAEGLVTLDGEPLPKARVVFSSPDHPMAVGTTDEQGRYQARTGSTLGISAGEYQVSVSAYKETKKPNNLEAPIPVLKTPSRYNDTTRSGLTASIQDGRNEVDFDLTTAPSGTD